MAEWLAGFCQYADDLRLHGALKGVGGFLLTVGSALFGLPHAPSEALLKLMVFDFALGAAHALKESEGLDPAKIARGIRKFIVYGVAINVARLLDVGTGATLFGISWHGAICGYLCANEALSALTHLEAFGFPFPREVKTRLRQYRDNMGRLHGPKGETHGN